MTEIQWLIDTFFVDHKLSQYLRRRRPGMSKRAFYRLRGHVRRHGIPPQTILVSEGGSPFMLPNYLFFSGDAEYLRDDTCNRRFFPINNDVPAGIPVPFVTNASDEELAAIYARQGDPA